MKITENNYSAGLFIVYTNRKNKSAPPVRRTYHSETKKDRVDLSPEAKEIWQTERQFNTIPDAREKMIENLKNQIDSGTYTIDEEKIASEIIKEAILNKLL